jgi:hypothetical protein
MKPRCGPNFGQASIPSLKAKLSLHGTVEARLTALAGLVVVMTLAWDFPQGRLRTFLPELYL